MKITIISLDNWGFNDHIARSLKSQGHQVRHIDFHSFVYKYPNFGHKLYNFLLKTFTGRNVKHIYYGKKILAELAQNPDRQDAILTLKGDFIDTRYIARFRDFTDRSIAFYNDNIKRYPNIPATFAYFDEVYSFEPEDCKKHNLRFLTNWIYNEIPPGDAPKDFENQVFNIGTKDKRLPLLYKIAQELKSKKISYRILVLTKKNEQSDTLQYIRKKLPLSEVNEQIKKSKTILDINRMGQSGLSFRIFESLGLHKKLITTNADIVRYDFYNPNNILVVDEQNPVIPAGFFETPYEPVPDDIFYKYTLKGWTETLFQTK